MIVELRMVVAVPQKTFDRVELLTSPVKLAIGFSERSTRAPITGSTGLDVFDLPVHGPVFPRWRPWPSAIWKVEISSGDGAGVVGITHARTLSAVSSWR